MDTPQVVKRRSIAYRAKKQLIEVIDLTLDSPIRNNESVIETPARNIEEIVCCSCHELVDVLFCIPIRNCSHRRCILCNIKVIKESATVRVQCPICEHQFEDREIRLFLTQQEYTNHVNKGTLYKQLIDLEQSSGFVPSPMAFECEICLLDIDVGDGVVIRNCGHQFCIDCVRASINNSTEATVKCPANLCERIIQDREIRSLITQAEYDKYSLKMLRIVESQSSNSFHCKKADCHSWAFVEDDVISFRCPICSSNNCLSCQAIHPDLNCLQYQNKQLHDGGLDDEERSNRKIEKMIKDNLGMRCPKCKIIIMKRDGCDFLRCSMCKTEICWATKQSRWGPRGRGDTSGGCGCSAFKKCSPLCRGCH